MPCAEGLAGEAVSDAAMIWLALALLWLGGIADYFVQAHMHGWATWGIPAHSTAEKWVWWLDWFPRDGGTIFA